MKSVSESGYHLDGVDKEIVYMLMDNAKTSLAHISKNVSQKNLKIKNLIATQEKMIYLMPYLYIDQ